MTDAPGYDVAQLAAALRSHVRGAVADDPGTRALYAVDASNYRVAPKIVVEPASVDDLVATVVTCSEADAPVAVRGGGTSMAGNAMGGVVVDVSRHLDRILDVDPRTRTAIVEPGVVLTDLQRAAGRHGLTFGADPSSASRATLGGMIANNACGAHSVAWGTTADNVRGLDVVLADGTRMALDTPGQAVDPARRRAEQAAGPGRAGDIHQQLGRIVDEHELLIRRRFGQFSRQISGYGVHRLLPEYGYDVARLLCGSEGTLAATTKATLELTPLPVATSLLVAGFADAVDAADAVPHLLAHRPLTVESINAALVDRLPGPVRGEARAAGLPQGQTWLLVEVGGDDPEQARGRGQTIVAALGDTGIESTSSLVTDLAAQAVLWRCRRDSTGLATRRADGAEAWGGWEDAAVPPDRLGEYLRRLDGLMARHGLSGGSYGHFGEGCMHIRIDFDLLDDTGVRTFGDFVEQAADLVISLGGSVSGEHGDGRARSALLSRMYGADGLELFAAVKRVWDPRGTMNPNVIVDPVPITDGLRLSGAAKRREPSTVFGYVDDAGSFAQAQRRCVGVGKCRQSTGGVMCPSYQVTREERHSTRGRAHLLWEMLEGDLVTDGWRSTEVREALDLCLSCKGCLSDCPVNVDMATYKAEFTHHHYRGRPWARPRSHWSMGWLPVWARLATVEPRLANKAATSPLAGPLKDLAGVTRRRPLPELARTPFTTWFRSRGGGRAAAGRGKVLLWPDTFTNYFAPEVGRATVRVLEDAGFEVVLPARSVCCGLTWISTGQLAIASRVLRRSIRALAPYLVADLPIVGMEPSCTAVFRHDVAQLLPEDRLTASVVASTHTLAELLQARAPDWSLPQVGGAALVQVHCHQHAVLGHSADADLMRAAGIDAVVPDSGCCGLAGNFGFERDHYALSLAAGERVLLPAVRAADPDTAVLADGFSCRTQIAHGTSTRPSHLAELLAAALPGNGT